MTAIQKSSKTPKNADPAINIKVGGLAAHTIDAEPDYPNSSLQLLHNIGLG
jgi:hypothetical protein